MNKPLCSVLALALCAVAGADARAGGPRPTTSTAEPSRAAKSTAPSKRVPRARPKVAPRKIERRLTRKQLQPTPNKEGSALLADVLVRVMEGHVETKMEKRLQKVLSSDRNKRAAAERLVKRWKAAPENARSKTFGRSALGTKPKPAHVQATIEAANLLQFYDMRPTVPLPAENVPLPASYQLNLAGVQSLAAHDEDGSDELALMVILAVPSGKAFTLQTINAPVEGTIATPGNATTNVDKTLYDGAAKGTLVITALVEDEGGGAAAARAEVGVMIDLAASVAATLEGSDRIAVLQSMVNYTVGMQNLGDPTDAAIRSIASVPIKLEEWTGLWGVDSEQLDGVPWKLAVPHTIGSGQYEVLLDVPSTLPDMRTVKVAIDKLWTDDAPFGPFKPWHMKLYTTIKSSLPAEFVFGDGVTSKNWGVTFERKVIEGNVGIGLEAQLWLKMEPPANAPNHDFYEYCSGIWFLGPGCNQFLKVSPIDLVPGDAKKVTTSYSTETNKFTGKPSNDFESAGDEGRMGGIEITANDVE